MAAAGCRSCRHLLRHGRARMHPYHPHRLSLLVAAVLLAPKPGSAAVQVGSGGGGGGGGAATPSAPDASASQLAVGELAVWRRYDAMFPAQRLVPVVARMHGHDVAYQLPAEAPRAMLFIAPGCAHAAHDWWPASSACPDCLGLPEEVAHTQQALARGYAVLAMSSKNAHGDMCMDWKTNHRDALALIADFRRSHGLQARPLYALGVSVGGGFVAKLAAFVKMDGVVSEVLGPKPAEWDLSRYQHGHPPTVFVSMNQDPAMAQRISGCSAKLRALGAATATVRVAPRAVYPAFFSDRSPRVSPAVSARVVAALRQIDMLDERGFVTVDPRHTKRPWVRQLVGLVPELDGAMGEDHSHVWEEMNLAWSGHEIIADFATPAFVWFEGGATANFSLLVDRYAAAGHTGSVGDALEGLPSPAPSTKPASPDVPHAYAVHEARVAAAEQQASPAGVHLPQPLQQGGGSTVRLAGVDAAQQRGATASLKAIAAPAKAGTAQAPAATHADVATANAPEAQPGSVTTDPAPEAADRGRRAPTLGAVLAGVAVALTAVGLLAGMHRSALCRCNGFEALPVTEPRLGQQGLAPPPSPESPLPVSTVTRLPSIPELPDTPTGAGQ